MTVNRDEVKSIFGRALDIESAEERGKYLDEACGDANQLRAEVESLLSAVAQAGNFLGGSASEVAATQDQSQPAEELGSQIAPTEMAENLGHPRTDEKPDTQIGPYKLLQKLGEGGMGVVYMAEQHEPVRRRVALKIIKPGMDTQQVIARFEAERQALAIMDHPNIARVLDAGATTSGRPYFVMELVHGVPFTEYCDQRHLTPAQRLRLFLPICEAVQHAHQKGIIHRDLKPSNVLVTRYDERPVPKVIDFGIAKATGQSLTDKTMFTQFGQVVGTLEYMSPEQAEPNQLDVDTRSDVYSLGVLLYELLTGTTPHDKKRLRAAAFNEILRIIREEEPAKPSVRLSTIDSLASVAANRNTEPHKLSTLVRGELDWIVMKAMEKDRTRRYETANGFAADIRRYLDDEPVEACPPSAGYRFQKFARRNKAILATASTIAVALLVGLVSTSWQWWRAERAREGEAEQTQLAQEQRNEALWQSEKNRRLLYVSDMIAAQQAWATANLRRVTELLDRHKPQAGKQDLRGFVWYYLSRLCQRGSETPTLTGHKDMLWSVALSPDGKTLASASQDGMVRLWDVDDVDTHQEKHTLEGHTVAVTSVAFSPDGKTLASGSPDGTIILWDVHTYEKEVLQVGIPVISVAISCDGTMASGSYDDAVRLWEVDANTEEYTLKRKYPVPAGGMIYAVGFSPDGRTLAAGCFDHTVKILDCETGKHLRDLSEHTAPVRSVAFSPDGKYLASASMDGTAMLWDLATGELRHILEGHTDRLWSVAFSPGSHLLASAANDGRVMLWDVETGREHDTLIGHENPVQAVAFSPLGGTLATGSVDRTVKLWDVNKDPVKVTLSEHMGSVSVAVSPDGTTLASGGEWDGTLRLWELDTGKELNTLTGHPRGVNRLAFYGKTLASGGNDPMPRVWDVDTGLQRKTPIEGHRRGVVYALAISPDGETLASGSSPDLTVKLWDMASGAQKMQLKDPDPHVVWSLAFSPEGYTLASGDYVKRVRLWDSITGALKHEFLGHTGAVFSVAFSPDGTILASGSDDGTVKLWDVRTTEELKTLRGHSGKVYAVAFSPDGGTLASGSLDTTIRLWDLATGKEPETLIGHVSALWSLAYSPDGDTLVSGSQDGEVRFWRRAPTGK